MNHSGLTLIFKHSLSLIIIIISKRYYYYFYVSESFYVCEFAPIRFILDSNSLICCDYFTSPLITSHCNYVITLITSSGLYCLEPWERNIFNVSLIIILSLSIYTSYLFMPGYIASSISMSCAVLDKMGTSLLDTNLTEKLPFC